MEAVSRQIYLCDWTDECNKNPQNSGAFVL